MNMEHSNMTDYKLDSEFLKDFILEMLKNPSVEDSPIQLPVFVQVTEVARVIDNWCSYVLDDGEFKMSGCAFMSQQAMPECFSILKIKNISKLPFNIRNNMKDFPMYGVAKIEFDIEVSGEQIGFSLCMGSRNINMENILKSKKQVGFWDVVKDLETPNPSQIMVEYMWKNRSEKFCDAKFTFEDDPNANAFVHKSVLMGKSEVFQTHFDNDSFIDKKVVHIEDSTVYSFNKLLEFIYTGKVQFTSWQLAFELLYLSKKYLISSLEDQCQRVIMEFCDYDSSNVWKVLHSNQKVNDENIKDYAHDCVRSLTREVISSRAFLNCSFSTVKWVLSLNDKLDIDEWTLLCSIFKWALHNRIDSFCQDENGSSENCFHAILESISFEKIGGTNLERFFNLPKLAEIVNVGELKQDIFDRLLQNGSYFSNLGVGDKCYSKFRSDNSFLIEVDIENVEEIEVKNLQLSRDEPLIGVKIRFGARDPASEEHALDVFLSCRCLFSTDETDIKKWISARACKSNSRTEDNQYYDLCKLSNKGDSCEIKLHLADCRGYLSERIEDFHNEEKDPKKSKILSLKINVDC